MKAWKKGLRCCLRGFYVGIAVGSMLTACGWFVQAGWCLIVGGCLVDLGLWCCLSFGHSISRIPLLEVTGWNSLLDSALRHGVSQ